MSNPAVRTLVHIVATAIAQMLLVFVAAAIATAANASSGSGPAFEMFGAWYLEMGLVPFVLWVLIVLLGVALRRRTPSAKWLVGSAWVAWAVVSGLWIALAIPSLMSSDPTVAGMSVLMPIIVMLYGLSLPLAAVLVAAVLRGIPRAEPSLTGNEELIDP